MAVKLGDILFGIVVLLGIIPVCRQLRYYNTNIDGVQVHSFVVNLHKAV